MNNNTKFRLWILLAVLCVLLFSSVYGVQAQDQQTITATGVMTKPDNSYNIPVIFHFSPAGGVITGSASFHDSETMGDGSVNTADVEWTFEGTFAGGDGGSVTGTVIGTGNLTGYPTFYYSGTWSGNLFASGIGEGVYDATVTAAGESSSGQFTWQVYYSADDFSTGLRSPITAEFIETTYGIHIVNYAGGSGQKEWSEHELSLMNDVFKSLPKEMIASMSVKTMFRADVDYDGSKPDPTTFGVFYPSSSSIVIFDHASSPYDFQDDPNGDIQFMATILHELVHSLQYKKDEYSNYDNPYKSPLVQSYMDATTPLNAVDTGIWENGWKYYQDRGKKGVWKSYTGEDNKPPTDYGGKNPCEDMSESVMMYVYNPRQLKDSSPLRYNFIRDQIFGGVEYENGMQQ